jgi:hypothetical protein
VTEQFFDHGQVLGPRERGKQEEAPHVRWVLGITPAPGAPPVMIASGDDETLADRLRRLMCDAIDQRIVGPRQCTLRAPSPFRRRQGEVRAVLGCQPLEGSTATSLDPPANPAEEQTKWRK